MRHCINKAFDILVRIIVYSGQWVEYIMNVQQDVCTLQMQPTKSWHVDLGYESVETDKNDVTLLLSWIYYHLSAVLDELPPRMQTFCTLYDRHTCSMCMRRQHYLCNILRIH